MKFQSLVLAALLTATTSAESPIDTKGQKICSSVGCSRFQTGAKGNTLGWANSYEGENY